MDKYNQQLQDLKLTNNYRQLPTSETAKLMDLCSNDYLGINAMPELRCQFLENFNRNYAFSASSSRLLSKELKLHSELEQLISVSYQKESALLFNSGYQANVGILSSLSGKNDLIIADKLIHASVIDGARLSKADFMRYKHLDYASLEQMLCKHRQAYHRVFIVSESVFSMDGDVADLAQLLEIKERYQCFLYIDEAHALGVRGEFGLGCAEEQNVRNKVDFIVGTMGKAMASVGAFVACKQLFKDYLINHSRAFIYSTALPPINIAWSSFVFERMQQMHAERNHLSELSKQFAAGLHASSNSHIVPFIIGSNAASMKQSNKLKQNGFNALPVRYPTVPKGTARLRFSLCASMKLEELAPLQQLLL